MPNGPQVDFRARGIFGSGAPRGAFTPTRTPAPTRTFTRPPQAPPQPELLPSLISALMAGGAPPDVEEGGAFNELLTALQRSGLTMEDIQNLPRREDPQLPTITPEVVPPPTQFEDTRIARDHPDYVDAAIALKGLREAGPDQGRTRRQQFLSTTMRQLAPLAEAALTAVTDPSVKPSERGTHPNWVNLTDPDKPSPFPEAVAFVNYLKPQTEREHSGEFWQNMGLWAIPSTTLMKGGKAVLAPAAAYTIRGKAAVGGLKTGAEMLATGASDYARAKLMGYSDEDAKDAGAMGGFFGGVFRMGRAWANWAKKAPDDAAELVYHNMNRADDVATVNALRYEAELATDPKLKERLLVQADELASRWGAQTPGQAAREMGVAHPKLVSDVAESTATGVGHAMDDLWKRADEIYREGFKMPDRIGSHEATTAWKHFRQAVEDFTSQVGGAAEKQAIDPVFTKAIAILNKVGRVVEDGKDVGLRAADYAQDLEVMKKLTPSEWNTIKEVLYRQRNFASAARRQTAAVKMADAELILAKSAGYIRKALNSISDAPVPNVAYEMRFGNLADDALKWWRNPVQRYRRFKQGQSEPVVFYGGSRKPEPTFRSTGQQEGRRRMLFEGKTLGDQLKFGLGRQQALLELKDIAGHYLANPNTGLSGAGTQFATAGAASMTGRPFLVLRATAAGAIPITRDPRIAMSGANIYRGAGRLATGPVGRGTARLGRAAAVTHAGTPDFRAPGILGGDTEFDRVMAEARAAVGQEETRPAPAGGWLSFDEAMAQAIAETGTNPRATTVPEEE